MDHKSLRAVLLFSFTSLVSACDGGGSNDDESSETLGAAEAYQPIPQVALPEYSAQSLQSSFSLQPFDTSVQTPTDNAPLDQASSEKLLHAIRSKVFESEFSDEADAPHLDAWDWLNLNNFADGAPYSTTYSCQARAAYLSDGEDSSGQGEYTIVSTLAPDLTGSVELIFDDCAINGSLRSGGRKITVFESPGTYYNEWSPSRHFRLEYDNYYWGTESLDYFVNGNVTYQATNGDDYDPPYKTLSNFTLAVKNAVKLEARDIATLCSDHYSGDFDAWRCEITGGEISLHDRGTYSVSSTSPFFRSLWSKNSKTRFADNSGNEFIYWAEGADKRLTWVQASGEENTFSVDYDSAALGVLSGPDSSGNAALETSVRHTEFKHWDKKMYAFFRDEYILFEQSGASTVDAIRISDLQQRTIDLQESAYVAQVDLYGDYVHSGHDGAIRSINLSDLSLASHKKEIGFGKIEEIHTREVVGYDEPGFDSGRTTRIRFDWDITNKRVREHKELNYGADAFVHFNRSYATTSYSDVYFYSDRYDNPGSTHVSTGANYDYLKFVHHSLVLTGSGTLIKCPSFCNQTAVYWRSLNEVIKAKYPSTGEQVVIAGTTDGGNGFGAASMLVFSTIPKIDLLENYYNEKPDHGTRLWALDLNDTRRITELALPLNSMTSPSVGFHIHDLAKAKLDGPFVGTGTWNLHSGRDNTVFFTIDPEKISFD